RCICYIIMYCNNYAHKRRNEVRVRQSVQLCVFEILVMSNFERLTWSLIPSEILKIVKKLECVNAPMDCEKTLLKMSSTFASECRCIVPNCVDATRRDRASKQMHNQGNG